MCHSRLCEGFVYISRCHVYCTTPCLEAQQQLSPLLLLKAFGLKKSRYLTRAIARRVYPIFREFGSHVSICFYCIRIPHELEGLCV